MPTSVARNLAAELETEFARLIRRHAVSQIMTVEGAGLDTFSIEVLAAIERTAPVRASRLAEEFAVTRTVVSRRVAALVRDGLIATAFDPQDGRASLLQLTADGRTELDRFRTYRREVFTDLFADWDRGEVGVFVAQLRRFNDAAQQLSRQPPRVGGRRSRT